ncbi:xanthine dehydrogenase accessory protein XdhC [Gellertiella hungarica]|uniref:Xanthine dehydrogenase accessory factor n=1 Tax=Gellertiella hungarica TaxID=1572859 RepID=A0A7W6J212_9HYPH|nr:xanthine dehydrogenase accessory protein XdhC [Gellertiella hungarica]MBB4063315.1 xanthine dehydrogenase accessory factor [Gellertiella hungarica]
MAGPSDSGTGGRASALCAFLETPEDTMLVRLARVEGSAPREEGTFMLVRPQALFGTIGGGFAEFDAIAHARALLSGNETAWQKIIILGPDTGQCCGGRLTLDFRPVDGDLAARLIREEKAAEAENRAVVLFGAGHVGKALARALAPLPFRVTVVETRSDELQGLPDGVDTVLTPMPEAVLRDVPAGAAVVILTHDHALDFLIAKEALERQDLAYVGMIGSATKRASFAGFWRREGGDPALLDHLTLPVGGNAVKDKRPAVIAALVAAELLMLPPRGARP